MSRNKWPKESDWKQIKRLTFFVTLFFVILISIHDKNITWNNDDQLIVWSGAYFERINYSEIDQVTLEDNLPNLKLRSNGYAAFGKKKGNFIRSSDTKKVLLFINRPTSKCIHIFLKDGDEVYLNFDKDKKTLEVFNHLKIRIQD